MNVVYVDSLTCTLVQIGQFLVSFQYLGNIDAHDIHHLYIATEIF